MSSRDRVLFCLAHREPDRVPLDIAGSDVTGIHRDAYRSLARCLGIEEDVPIWHRVQQLALPSEDVLERFEVDVRPLFPKPPEGWAVEVRDAGRYLAFEDEWGVEWVMPKLGGLYYDMIGHPLSEVSEATELACWNWPDGANQGRFGGLRDRAEELVASGMSASRPPH